MSYDSNVPNSTIARKTSSKRTSPSKEVHRRAGSSNSPDRAAERSGNISRGAVGSPERISRYRRLTKPISLTDICKSRINSNVVSNSDTAVTSRTSHERHPSKELPRSELAANIYNPQDATLHDTAERTIPEENVQEVWHLSMSAIEEQSTHQHDVGQGEGNYMSRDDFAALLDTDITDNIVELTEHDTSDVADNPNESLGYYDEYQMSELSELTSPFSDTSLESFDSTFESHISSDSEDIYKNKDLVPSRPNMHLSDERQIKGTNKNSVLPKHVSGPMADSLTKLKGEHSSISDSSFLEQSSKDYRKKLSSSDELLKRYSNKKNQKVKPENRHLPKQVYDTGHNKHCYSYVSGSLTAKTWESFSNKQSTSMKLCDYQQQKEHPEDRGSLDYCGCQSKQNDSSRSSEQRSLEPTAELFRSKTRLYSETPRTMFSHTIDTCSTWPYGSDRDVFASLHHQVTEGNNIDEGSKRRCKATAYIINTSSSESLTAEDESLRKDRSENQQVNQTNKCSELQNDYYGRENILNPPSAESLIIAEHTNKDVSVEPVPQMLSLKYQLIEEARISRELLRIKKTRAERLENMPLESETKECMPPKIDKKTSRLLKSSELHQCKGTFKERLCNDSSKDRLNARSEENLANAVNEDSSIVYKDQTRKYNKENKWINSEKMSCDKAKFFKSSKSESVITEQNKPTHSIKPIASEPTVKTVDMLKKTIPNIFSSSCKVAQSVRSCDQKEIKKTSKHNELSKIAFNKAENTDRPIHSDNPTCYSSKEKNNKHIYLLQPPEECQDKEKVQTGEQSNPNFTADKFQSFGLGSFTKQYNDTTNIHKEIISSESPAQNENKDINKPSEKNTVLETRAISDDSDKDLSTGTRKAIDKLTFSKQKDVKEITVKSESIKVVSDARNDKLNTPNCETKDLSEKCKEQNESIKSSENGIKEISEKYEMSKDSCGRKTENSDNTKFQSHTKSDDSVESNRSVVHDINVPVGLENSPVDEIKENSKPSKSIPRTNALNEIAHELINKSDASEIRVCNNAETLQSCERKQVKESCRINTPDKQDSVTPIENFNSSRSESLTKAADSFKSDMSSNINKDSPLVKLSKQNQVKAASEINESPKQTSHLISESLAIACKSGSRNADMSVMNNKSILRTPEQNLEKESTKYCDLPKNVTSLRTDKSNTLNSDDKLRKEVLWTANTIPAKLPTSCDKKQIKELCKVNELSKDKSKVTAKSCNSSEKQSVTKDSHSQNTSIKSENSQINESQNQVPGVDGTTSESKSVTRSDIYDDDQSKACNAEAKLDKPKQSEEHFKMKESQKSVSDTKTEISKPLTKTDSSLEEEISKLSKQCQDENNDNKISNVILLSKTEDSFTKQMPAALDNTDVEMGQVKTKRRTPKQVSFAETNTFNIIAYEADESALADSLKEHCKVSHYREVDRMSKINHSEKINSALASSNETVSKKHDPNENISETQKTKFSHNLNKENVNKKHDSYKDFGHSEKQNTVTDNGNLHKKLDSDKDISLREKEELVRVSRNENLNKKHDSYKEISHTEKQNSVHVSSNETSNKRNGLYKGDSQSEKQNRVCVSSNKRQDSHKDDSHTEKQNSVCVSSNETGNKTYDLYKDDSHTGEKNSVRVSSNETGNKRQDSYSGDIHTGEKNSVRVSSHEIVNKRQDSHKDDSHTEKQNTVRTSSNETSNKRNGLYKGDSHTDKQNFVRVSSNETGNKTYDLYKDDSHTDKQTSVRVSSNETSNKRQDSYSGDIHTGEKNSVRVSSREIVNKRQDSHKDDTNTDKQNFVRISSNETSNKRNGLYSGDIHADEKKSDRVSSNGTSNKRQDSYSGDIHTGEKNSVRVSSREIVNKRQDSHKDDSYIEKQNTVRTSSNETSNKRNGLYKGDTNTDKQNFVRVSSNETGNKRYDLYSGDIHADEKKSDRVSSYENFNKRQDPHKDDSHTEKQNTVRKSSNETSNKRNGLYKGDSQSDKQTFVRVSSNETNNKRNGLYKDDSHTDKQNFVRVSSNETSNKRYDLYKDDSHNDKRNSVRELSNETSNKTYDPYNGHSHTDKQTSVRVSSNETSNKMQDSYSGDIHTGEKNSVRVPSHEITNKNHESLKNVTHTEQYNSAPISSSENINIKHDSYKDISNETHNKKDHSYMNILTNSNERNQITESGELLKVKQMSNINGTQEKVSIYQSANVPARSNTYVSQKKASVQPIASCEQQGNGTKMDITNGISKEVPHSQAGNLNSATSESRRKYSSINNIPKEHGNRPALFLKPSKLHLPKASSKLPVSVSGTAETLQPSKSPKQHEVPAASKTVAELLKSFEQMQVEETCSPCKKHLSRAREERLAISLNEDTSLSKENKSTNTNELPKCPTPSISEIRENQESPMQICDDIPNQINKTTTERFNSAEYSSENNNLDMFDGIPTELKNLLKQYEKKQSKELHKIEELPATSDWCSNVLPCRTLEENFHKNKLNVNNIPGSERRAHKAVSLYNKYTSSTENGESNFGVSHVQDMETEDIQSEICINTEFQQSFKPNYEEANNLAEGLRLDNDDIDICSDIYFQHSNLLRNLVDSFKKQSYVNPHFYKSSTDLSFEGQNTHSISGKKYKQPKTDTMSLDEFFYVTKQMSKNKNSRRKCNEMFGKQFWNRPVKANFDYVENSNIPVFDHLEKMPNFQELPYYKFNEGLSCCFDEFPFGVFGECNNLRQVNLSGTAGSQTPYIQNKATRGVQCEIIGKEVTHK